MPLSDERKGQIALQILNFLVRKEGIRLSAASREEIESLSKEIGVPVGELLQLAKEIVDGVVRETFSWTSQPHGPAPKQCGAYFFTQTSDYPLKPASRI